MSHQPDQISFTGIATAGPRIEFDAPIDGLKNKAILGQAIGNGDIIIAVDAVYQQAKKTNGRVNILEESMLAVKKDARDLFDSVKAMNEGKIVEAARKQGLWVFAKGSGKVLGFIGFSPMLAMALCLWHIIAVTDHTNQTVNEHSSFIEQNQNAIKQIVKRDETKDAQGQ